LLHFRELCMSNGARERDNPERQTPEEAALSARLRHLGDRLDQQRPSEPAANAGAPPIRADASGMARGLRLSSELVAGVLVGGVIGWSLDHWLGISPWGLIVFLLLGFTAGVLNVMRTAGVVAERGERD
jgi:ATP synthase protein I